jgi:hypothetical protein
MVSMASATMVFFLLKIYWLIWESGRKSSRRDETASFLILEMLVIIPGRRVDFRFNSESKNGGSPGFIPVRENLKMGIFESI